MDLTIVIPTHNREGSVVECALALEHNDVEIVIVDDGSDRQPVIPVRNLKILRHERHQGRAAALNTGMRAASHDAVLMLDDDIYASPDMVVRLIDEFSIQTNPKRAVVSRVVWDPDVPLTLTMRWLEQYSSNLGEIGNSPLIARTPRLFWRPFVLQHGGFDEDFKDSSLADVELALRLRKHGLDVQVLDSAIAFHHRVVTVRDLTASATMDGVSAVHLHGKMPEFLPLVKDTDALLQNESQTLEAEAAVEEIALLEKSEATSMPPGAADLFPHIYRHYFLTGVLKRLRDSGALRPPRQVLNTLAIYNQAWHLMSAGEWDESRRLFRLVLNRPHEEYWAGAEYHLGCIEAELGNPPAAYTHFSECLRLNPEHQGARAALQ